MGTEVLRPQDCLIERIRVQPAAISRRRNYGSFNYYNNNNINNSSSNCYAGRGHRKPATRPEQRKRVVERRPSSDDSRVARSSGMVMEKVTILRRGESLDSKIRSGPLKREGDDLVVTGTQRLGPDPEMVPKQVKIKDFKSACDVYAGSAFAVSPSPSALPLPSFSRKQLPTVVDDSATRDLRRLLRLE